MSRCLIKDRPGCFQKNNVWSADNLCAIIMFENGWIQTSHFMYFKNTNDPWRLFDGSSFILIQEYKCFMSASKWKNTNNAKQWNFLPDVMIAR